MAKKLIDAEQLEQLLKSENISQKANKYEPLFRQGYLNGLNQVCSELRAFPATDVQEVRHGEWLETSGYIISIDGTPAKWTIFYCSECEVPVDSPTKYCPNCGAKMDGIKER